MHRNIAGRKAADIDIWETRWHSGPYSTEEIRRTIREGYTHLVRAADDPERRPREVRHQVMGVEEAATQWRNVEKIPSPVMRDMVMALMADGQPRTANRIAVELFDLTADATDKVHQTLFDLVEEGYLQHSLEIPILFLVVWEDGKPPPLLPPPPPGVEPRRWDLPPRQVGIFETW